MEAQEILPVMAGGALKQESDSRGANDEFRTLLREYETRGSAARGDTSRTDASHDRAEHDAERSAGARRRSDAARETRNDDRYLDKRDDRPEADDIQPTDRSDRRDPPDESQARTDRPGPDAEPATAKADTQGHDDTSIAGDTPAETEPGDEETPDLATPAIAATPFVQVADSVPAQAPAAATAPKPASSKEAASNAPRPPVTPATAAPGPQAALNGAVTTPVPSEAETAAAPAPATDKAIQSATPVVPAEAAIPLNAAQGKRPQASGQKAGAPAASSEAAAIVASPDKENQAPAAARVRLDHAGHNAAANAASPVKAPAQADANQAARANPVLVPRTLDDPGQRTPAASDAAAQGLKTAASAGNTGQAPAGLTGIDPIQGATRAAGAPSASAPTADRPVPLNEVAVNIQRAAARGEDRISIRLHPAELGQVDVRLKVGADGIVRAMVQVDRPETLDLMQRDSRGLERALQDAGLKTDSGSLSFNLRDNGGDGLQDRDGNGDTSMAGREQADANSSAATEAAEIPIHTGWSSRALDIRV